MSSEAQSEVIGVLLLLSISITAIGVILLFGQPVITGAEGDVQFDRMENEFSLLDASMSSSVLGASESQSVSLNVEGGRLETNPDASWMSVVYEDPTGKDELANITMGNLRYVQDGKTLAYEGGGVWRSNENENFTSMISSPEFHYRGSTLTLPSYDVKDRINIAGTRNSLSIESGGDPTLLFPDEDLDNPLQKGNLTVTVKSEYYRGWESFFRERTSGAIEEVNDGEQKVVVGLETPSELLLNSGITYAQGNNEDAAHYQQAGGTPITDAEPAEVEFTDPELLVEPELNKCNLPDGDPDTSDCVNLEDVPSDSSLNENKRYYVDSPSSTYHLDKGLAAPNGNVTIVVNGDLQVDTNGDFAVDASSDDPVEFYVDGDLNYQGGPEINTNSASVDGVTGSGRASLFITYITDEAPGDLAEGMGAVNYRGVIYAPNNAHGTPSGGCDGDNSLGGSVDITGAFITESVCTQKDDTVTYDEDLDILDITPDVSIVRYLHITENEIRVSS